MSSLVGMQWSFEDIAQYNGIWIDDSPNARGELIKSEMVTIPDEATGIETVIQDQ